MIHRFLEKYYPAWSFLWVLQRVLLKLKDFKFQSFSWKILWNDYKLHQKTKRSIRENEHRQLKQDDSENTITAFPENEPSLRQWTCSDVAIDDLSYVNSYFDQVYVINLQKRKNRREKMISTLEALRIKAEIVSAVDGYLPENLEEFKKYYHTPVDPHRPHELELKLKRKVIYSPGAWGTLKTYHKLLRDAKKRKFKRILSLEDDALFAIDFENLFTNAITTIPDSWKLLYLGASQHSWEKGVDLNYPENIHKNEAPRYYHPIKTDGAFAIGIDCSVFDMIIQDIEKMNCSFDSGPLRHVCRAHHSECYVLQPNIIIADVTESDNSIGRNMEDFARTVRWNLSLFEWTKKI